MMQDTINGMNNIDSSTQQIAEMISIITDISDQVNLLALNASIEAARAGEHGKGFAIVAEEISKLAEETASTAQSITDLVKIGLKEVATGRKFVDNTKNSFDSIISNIHETEILVKNITESSRQQFSSSEKVLADTKSVLEMAEAINVATNEQMITNQEMSKTIEQINQGTLSEAARSEEIASSAADINSQAVALREDIKFFKL
jgi:methyl-accepting chemotaxis protein